MTICGQVSGEQGRCQAVADFLQSLLDSVVSHSTTLRFPGVARFLRDPAGQSLLRQLESRFQCVIQLEGEPWSPPDPQVSLVGRGLASRCPCAGPCRGGDAAPRSPQLELEELLPPNSHGDPRSHSWHLDLPEETSAAAADEGDDDGFHSNAGEGATVG